MLEALWRSDRTKKAGQKDVDVLEKLILENEATLGGERVHAALVALARLKGTAIGFEGLSVSADEVFGPGFVDKPILAALMKCNVRTVENMMVWGKIPYIKLGKKLVRFDWEKVKARLNETSR
jgi:hypothetical protein